MWGYHKWALAHSSSLLPISLQVKVFNDLGKGVLENAWNGYNCSLFAYGQTGSGKSYSMVGYGNNKGIVPMFCDDLFDGIEKKRETAGENEEYQVRYTRVISPS